MNTIKIHNKVYVPVSARVEAAHKDQETISITTELIKESPVLFKATVVTKKGTFTGWSAANPTKSIEKTSPYEVAETSAVGRALGFAGYGIVEGIASAEEVAKAQETASTSAPQPEMDEIDKALNQTYEEMPDTSKRLASEKQVKYIQVLIRQKGADAEQIKKNYGVTSSKELTSSQAKRLIDQLMLMPTVNSYATN